MLVMGLTVATIPGTAQANPAEPATGELAGLMRDLLTLENAAVLADADRERVTAGVRPRLTASAQAKAAARMSLSEDRRVAREAAGAQVGTVRTDVEVKAVTGAGNRRVADVVETRHQPVKGSKDGNTGTWRHQVTFEWLNGQWAIADIAALDPTSPFTDGALKAATAVPAEQRRADIAARVASVKAGLDANRSALVAADAAKMANKQVKTPDAHPSGQDKEVGKTTGLGRPEGKPFVGIAHDQVQTQDAAYDYERMVALAWWYGHRDEGHKVPYVRDENDCTTFISWVLSEGGYEEHGNESLPAAYFNYRDFDVWYYRCNDCEPRKTFTWGAARNWNIFENNYGGRVTFMPYLSDLLLSDVLQMDINGYGDPPDIPDHTMMVTGRGEDGWPLLSYHSNDERDKPFWDVIRGQDGPFWAIRT
jgi:hypothetical protein